MNGFTREELYQTIPIIRQNTISCINTVLNALGTLKIDLNDASNRETIFKFQELSADFKDNKQRWKELKMVARSFLNDDGFIECLRRSHEFILPDSAEYFIGRVSQNIFQCFIFFCTSINP